MKLRTLVANAVIVLTCTTNAQDHVELHNAEVLQLEFLGVTQAYRDWDHTAKFTDERVRDENGVIVKQEARGVKESRLHQAVNPLALPQGADPVWQDRDGVRQRGRALDLSINGMGNTGVNPADPCLEVGPNHVIQMINGASGAYFQIFNKTGASLGPQTYLDNFINGIGGIASYSGLGDPIVLYDALADRWLMSEFSSSGNRMVMCVSTTADPLGTWYTYSFTAPSFPDYPKYAVWNTAYIITSNEGTGCPIYALDRTKMLSGLAATSQRFTTPDYPTIGFQATTPITFEGGTAPPAGAPAMVMRMADDAWSGTIPNDRLELWTLTLDFVTPANSVLAGPSYMSVSSFSSDLCGFTSFSCIDQPGTTTNLDPLREVIMNRAAYRNFGGHESIVCNHVTDVNATDRAGVRWYELRRTGGIANPWSIYQEGTYSPDATNRWMGMISINAVGDIGLAYNVSSGSVFPGIRYTGRYASDPLGQMTFAETTAIAGVNFNSSNRYGDYNSLDVDPVTGNFWGTAQHNPANAWSTRIFSFSFPAVGCTAPTVSQSVVDNCGAGTFTLSVTIGANGDAPNYDVYTSVNGGAQVFNSTRTPGTYVVGTYAFGTSVVTQVRHNVNAACNQTLAAATSTGSACCTAPSAVVSGSCLGATNYNVSVNLTSMGSATSIAIQIDADAGGPGLPVTVQTVTAIGSYGPFGNYTSGSPVNVILVHNLFSLCNLAVNGFVRNCNVPGAGCSAYTSTGPTTIVDNTTVTNNIVVPALGGATISDLNVYVNITHTWVSDLRLTLTSPTGTAIALINSGLCTDQDNINVEFDQTGANGNVGATCPMNNLYVIPAVSLAGFNGQVFQGTWTLSVQDVVTQDAGTLNSWCLIPTLLNPNVSLTPKVFMEGPYNSGAGTMTDALRTLPTFPLSEPYTAMGFVNAAGGGGETTTAGVLAVTGNNAIVDWVRIELRNNADPTVLVASRHALVQRDGDVVSAADGASAITMGVSAGNYYVVVRHRNHLGCMTASAMALSNVAVPVNFTIAGTLTYGTNARTSNGAVQLLWSGNSVRDTPPPSLLKYTGTANDRDPILTAIGGTVPTLTINGYYLTDVNMDGVVKYTGTLNDRDPILVNVGGTIPTATRTEQVP
jgi:subtilisin-like proprotein convertase family protein